MQVNIGATNGKTYQVELENPESILGKQIGETFQGGIVDLDGYELEITGGSDKQGFPMRENIDGSERQKKLIKDGSGIQTNKDGVKQRKSVRGNTVSEEIQQLNVKVVEEGDQEIEEALNESENEE